MYCSANRRVVYCGYVKGHGCDVTVDRAVIGLESERIGAVLVGSGHVDVAAIGIENNRAVDGPGDQTVGQAFAFDISGRDVTHNGRVFITTGTTIGRLWSLVS